MAAKRVQASTKRLLIGKANSIIVVAVGLAAFVTMSSLVLTHSLLAKRSYQAKVIAKQEAARNQLQKNIKAVDDLVSSYKEFEGRPTNIIGGSSTGKGDRDGDNAKITLDSLPSKYDFPAMASSLEKILVDRRYSIVSITGKDEEVAQNVSTAQGSTSHTTGSGAAAQASLPIEMPFEISVSGSYDSSIGLLTVLQQSIRPMHVQKLGLTASGGPGGSGVDVSIVGISDYQPEKALSITYEEVK